MAYGVQAYHEVTALQVLALGERLGVPLTLNWEEYEDDEYEWQEREVDPLLDLVNPKLAEIHLSLVRRMFDPNAATRQRPDMFAGCVDAITPVGPRQFSPFYLGLIGDTGEMGETFPDDFIWGIKIAGRYKPTWIDWREAHGVGQYKHDEQMYRMAVEAIGESFPELAAGQVAVRMQHF